MMEKVKDKIQPIFSGGIVTFLMGVVTTMVLGVSSYAFYQIDDLREAMDKKATKEELCLAESRATLLNDKLRAELALSVTRIENDIAEVKQMIKEIKSP